MDDEQENSALDRRDAVLPIPISMIPRRQASGLEDTSSGAIPDAEKRPPTRLAEDPALWEPGEDEEEAMLLAAAEEEQRPTSQNAEQATSSNKEVVGSAPNGGEMSEGVMAALARLREKQ